MNQGLAAAPKDTPAHLPVCGVVVVSIVCMISHAEAFAAVKKAGNYGPNWKGRTYHEEREKAAAEYGVTMDVLIEDVTTLKKWVLTRSKPGTIYAVCTPGHVQTVLNGRIYDQVHPHGEPIESYGHANKRINFVAEILSGPLFDHLRTY